MKRARPIPHSGTVGPTVSFRLEQVFLIADNSLDLTIITCLFFFSFLSLCLDVEHRKSFAEMTEAQVHPASSASAPEGFLATQDNPNGNDHSTSMFHLVFVFFLALFFYSFSHDSLCSFFTVTSHRIRVVTESILD